MSTDHNSIIVGKVLHAFDCLPSTNQYAIELLASANPPEGTVIAAKYQSAGRGQMGTHWESESGMNLLLSVILRPQFLSVEEQFTLNKAISLAVLAVLDSYFPNRIAIKWPNDIYIDQGKICGILIQNGISGKKLQWTVVGIGLNVNQIGFSNATNNATSMARELGQQVDLIDLRKKLFYQLDLYYSKLKSGDPVLNELYARSLYRAGIPTTFTDNRGEIFTGTIERVDKQGKLVIKSGTEIKHFNLKEISYQ
ncbi:MAG: biotin--[acetyl-CoA-carboxylase] ligase [Saprospiraceae bacterium]|nr:biotin--[acetyl-CoA-carboxylase] ligase [Saprospiraceae bacterium]